MLLSLYFLFMYMATEYMYVFNINIFFKQYINFERGFNINKEYLSKAFSNCITSTVCTFFWLLLLLSFSFWLFLLLCLNKCLNTETCLETVIENLISISWIKHAKNNNNNNKKSLIFYIKMNHLNLHVNTFLIIIVWYIWKVYLWFFFYHCLRKIKGG